MNGTHDELRGPSRTDAPPALGAESLRVIVVDDDESSAAGLAAAVARLGHTPRIARNGEEALSLHRANRADVILSDWRMPRMDGFELCKAIRAAEVGDPGASPYTYFVFVTASGDKAHFIEGMHAGADDYLPKPVDFEELEVRLEAARRVIMLYRRLATSNERLRKDSALSFQAARTDSLTTISNRLRMKEDLDRLDSRVSRYGHRYCAALCDIDRFKDYNDAFGHQAGDDVLRRVTCAIRNELRRGDTFYRYGGEEFLAILPEQSLEQGASVMDRVRRAVEQLRIPHAPSASLPFVTVSIGVAELNSGSTGGTEGWLGRADRALFGAKARGRNRVETEQTL
jgi:two-component system cell cycle response regulator